MKKIDPKLSEEVNHIHKNPVFDKLLFFPSPKIHPVESDLIFGCRNTKITSGMNRFYPGPSRGSRVVAFRDQGIEVLNLAVRIRFQPGFLMKILELAQPFTGADPTRSIPLNIFSEIMFDSHTLQIALVN